jgi:ABC-type lipoprotein export system ATPase subunit
VLSVASFEFQHPRVPRDRPSAPIVFPAFCAAPGELVWLSGNSGCGKTSLLQLIAGLIPTPKGVIRLFDEDVTTKGISKKPNRQYAVIGFIPQEPLLIDSLTAHQNAILPHALTGHTVSKQVDLLFKALDIAHVAHQQPAQLSRGQQQRVAIARAFANKPLLLLADEPTANLDDARTADVMACIQQLCLENGTAAVIASHDCRIAPHCTRKVVFA